MGHLATTKPDKALHGIQQDPELSDSSKHTYAQRLMAMSAKLGQPISELAMQPMTIIPWIKKQYPEVATQKNVVTAVLANGLGYYIMTVRSVHVSVCRLGVR